jgi:uncharacterized protein YeaO (DUF488 family)
MKQSPQPAISIKRIYDPPAGEDGVRVLVDRLWPRGVSKTNAMIDHWAKDLAPSDGLRKWFAHDPSRWNAFQDHYRAELEGRAEALADLLTRNSSAPITLLFSAKDRQHNQAVVLKDVLIQMASNAGPKPITQT